MVIDWESYSKKQECDFMAEQETLFERLARERNISVEEMREQIAARIERGWNDPDSEKRGQWRKILCEGKMPTPDEWLKYAVERLTEEGREDLLRWYPNV